MPGLTGGKLPEDGIKQGTRGGAGTAPPPTPAQILPLRGRDRVWRGELRTASWKTLKNLVIVLHDDQIVELTGGIILGEAPTVGGNDDWRLAGEPIQVWIGRDERGKDGPLTVGEVSGEAGVI